MHNYQKEEEIANTPEVALDNWNAASGALDNVVIDTAAKLNRNYELLDWVEKNVAPENVPFVQESKAITHEMAERITQFDAIRTQAGGFMAEMFNRHQRMAEDYEELEQAVSDGDRTNPFVDRLVSDFEEGMEEIIYDQMRIDAAEEYEEAFAAAYDNVFTELHEGIKEATGCTDWTLIYRLTNVLTGQEEPTDEQLDALKNLVATFQKPEDHNDSR